VKPGAYTEPVPPTPAERDILANGRYGGTILARYLDPPHMDFNRTLSSTVNSPMDWTKNKLTRAAFGPYAEQYRVTIEPDLAEKWEVSGDSTQFTFHSARARSSTTLRRQRPRVHIGRREGELRALLGRWCAEGRLGRGGRGGVPGQVHGDLQAEPAARGLPDDDRGVVAHGRARGNR
jgi:hypothetical protein